MQRKPDTHSYRLLPPAQPAQQPTGPLCAPCSIRDKVKSFNSSRRPKKVNYSLMTSYTYPMRYVWWILERSSAECMGTTSLKTTTSRRYLRCCCWLGSSGSYSRTPTCPYQRHVSNRNYHIHHSLNCLEDFRLVESSANLLHAVHLTPVQSVCHPLCLEHGQAAFPGLFSCSMGRK